MRLYVSYKECEVLEGRGWGEGGREVPARRLGNSGAEIMKDKSSWVLTHKRGELSPFHMVLPSVGLPECPLVDPPS